MISELHGGKLPLNILIKGLDRWETVNGERALSAHAMQAVPLVVLNMVCWRRRAQGRQEECRWKGEKVKKRREWEVGSQELKSKEQGFDDLGDQENWHAILGYVEGLQERERMSKILYKWGQPEKERRASLRPWVLLVSFLDLLWIFGLKTLPQNHLHFHGSYSKQTICPMASFSWW